MDLRVLALIAAVMVIQVHSAVIQQDLDVDQESVPVLVEDTPAENDDAGAELLRQTRNVCWLGSWACNKYCKIFGQQGGKQGECVSGSCQCIITSGR